MMIIVTVTLIFVLVWVTMVIGFLVWSKLILPTYTKYKRENTYPESIDDVLVAITTIVNSEFAIYESNRFREAGPKLTASSFQNYYMELTGIILGDEKHPGDLSDEFYERARIYMSDAAIANMVSELVRNYLTTKLGTIQTIDDEEEES